MKLTALIKHLLPMVAGLTLTSAAEAARIRFYVMVPGYSSVGWVAVRPELRSTLGGRVAYVGGLGCGETE